MFNLSLTACSFHFRKKNTKDNAHVYDLNRPFVLTRNDGNTVEFNNVQELFADFFVNHLDIQRIDEKKQTFSCEYDSSYMCDKEKFVIQYVRINSGLFGNSSSIVDGESLEERYSKKTTDIDIRPFYLMIIIPKDSSDLKIQKGIFFFQNLGIYGIKTITTRLMKDFFSTNYSLTLRCNNIAPELFVRKVLNNDSIKKLVVIKNIQSQDPADNLTWGYGREERCLSHLRVRGRGFNDLIERLSFYVANRSHIFEFEGQEYDGVKVVVDIGGRIRTIDLSNIDNLSIIEGIPDEIRMLDGNPNLEMLIEHFSIVANEYIGEMVLRIVRGGSWL